MNDASKDEVVADLRKIPGVGANAAEALYRLGVRKEEDLKGRSPEDMYEELRNMKDFYAEPCMLNSLKVAVKHSSIKK